MATFTKEGLEPITIKVGKFNWWAAMFSPIWFMTKGMYGWAIGMLVVGKVVNAIPADGAGLLALLAVCVAAQVWIGLHANSLYANKLASKGYSTADTPAVASASAPEQSPA